MMVEHTVAVYGTLRDSWLQGVAIDRNPEFPESGEYTPRHGQLYGYILKDTLHGFPAIFPNSDVHPNPIKVELVTVTDTILDRLDGIEGIDRGLYVRKQVQVNVEGSRGLILAWIYEGGDTLQDHSHEMDVIESGDWIEYKIKHDYEMANR